MGILKRCGVCKRYGASYKVGDQILCRSCWEAERPSTRVLVCAPEPHVQRLVQVNLEKSGSPWVTVGTVEEAIGQLVTSEFALVIVDPTVEAAIRQWVTTNRAGTRVLSIPEATKKPPSGGF